MFLLSLIYLHIDYKKLNVIFTCKIFQYSPTFDRGKKKIEFAHLEMGERSELVMPGEMWIGEMVIITGSCLVVPGSIPGSA